MVHLLPRTTVKPLQAGDEINIVAASSAITDENSLLEGLSILEGWGLSCRYRSVSKNNWGYLAEKDSVRFRSLHPKNPAPLLAFARGGWGAARLLERSQPWRPGWLLGFSDVTSLLLARLAAGFDGGIHGPLLTSLASEPKWSQKRLKSLLFTKSVPDLFGTPWQNGVGNGPLVVANLTVASHLLGSSHIPNLEGTILIFEDIGESPYRIDRMLTQWRLAGILQKLVGLGFGSFNECNAPKEVPLNKTFQIEEVLKERTLDLNIPVVGNLPIGHCCGNAALPLGQTAILNGGTGSLSVITS